jgi:hypothetical protein
VVSNDQGVHMSITLNSQIHSFTTTDNACGCSIYALQPNTRRAYTRIAH